MSQDFIIAIDQGTTGSRVFCFDARGRVLSSAYREFTQHFPKPGWVEHDPLEIWKGVEDLLGEALQQGGLDGANCAAIGITNQRETAVLWDRKTGQPVHNAIVWQCRRTSARCNELKRQGHEELVRERTGLVIDAYFSGTKFEWFLQNVSGVRERAEKGELAAGTIDSWLLFKLTGEHATEYTNASRTMIYDIKNKRWDPDLCKLLNLPEAMLPEVKASGADFGKTKGLQSLPDGVPVYAMLGDQQAALFGQLRVNPGEAKNTYGTGCFFLFNTGDQFLISKAGLITTLAVNAKGEVCYALEGAIFIAGAVVQWLRDSLEFFRAAPESEDLARSVHDDGDHVVFVPAFAGLGAPHWDMQARGAIFGLSRDTTPARITRAALKSIALQTYDLAESMEKDTGKRLDVLRVDGGAANNNYLLQYQADVLGVPVERPSNVDTTALGAAYLAGMRAGVWSGVEDLLKLQSDLTRIEPAMDPDVRKREIHYWRKAVDRVRDWVEE